MGGENDKKVRNVMLKVFVILRKKEKVYEDKTAEPGILA